MEYLIIPQYLRENQKFKNSKNLVLGHISFVYKLIGCFNWNTCTPTFPCRYSLDKLRGRKPMCKIVQIQVQSFSFTSDREKQNVISVTPFFLFSFLFKNFLKNLFLASSHPSVRVPLSKLYRRCFHPTLPWHYNSHHVLREVLLQLTSPCFWALSYKLIKTLVLWATFSSPALPWAALIMKRPDIHFSAFKISGRGIYLPLLGDSVGSLTSSGWIIQ